MLAAFTGIRRGEALAARRSDIDFENNHFTLKHSLEETRAGGVRLKPPKSGKERPVTLCSPTAMAALRRHRARQATERLAAGAAFKDQGLNTHSTGRLPDWKPSRSTLSVSLLIAAKLAKEGYPLTAFHAIRHSHSDILQDQGENPNVVAHRLGHSSATITLDRYSKVSPEAQRRAADRIQAALGNRVV